MHPTLSDILRWQCADCGWLLRGSYVRADGKATLNGTEKRTFTARFVDMPSCDCAREGERSGFDAHVGSDDHSSARQ